MTELGGESGKIKLQVTFKYNGGLENDLEWTLILLASDNGDPKVALGECSVGPPEQDGHHQFVFETAALSNDFISKASQRLLFVTCSCQGEQLDAFVCLVKFG